MEEHVGWRAACIWSKGVHGSVFIKKSNQTEFFLKKKKSKLNRNRLKPTSFGSVRFFREKTGSNRFGSVFSVWLGLARFFGLTRFWLGFFGLARFFSVRFGFSGSRLKKPKPNRTSRFFQNFNRFNWFFFTVRFFRLFFFRFSHFNRFFWTPLIWSLYSSPNS